MNKRIPKTEGAEKRLHPRKTLRTKIVFEDESGEGFIYFYSTDVSAGGLFLESDVPLKIGTRVFLSFALKDGISPIRTTGQVVRVERESAEGPSIIGMGVRFLDLTDSARQSIETFVS